MARLFVVDAGPLIHLSQADAFHLLDSVGDLLVPQTVLDELDHGPTELSGLEFETTAILNDVESVHTHLEAGETAALILCSERDAGLLTDDLDARRTAQEHGIEVHGSVGVVLAGYSRGMLSKEAAKGILHALERETNLYLSTPLIEHAIDLIESGDAGW